MKCINCKKTFNKIMRFDFLGKYYYSIDFCCDKCLQKYHQTNNLILYQKLGENNNIEIEPKRDIKKKNSKKWNILNKIKGFAYYTRFNNQNIPIYDYIIK